MSLMFGFFLSFSFFLGICNDSSINFVDPVPWFSSFAPIGVSEPPLAPLVLSELSTRFSPLAPVSPSELPIGLVELPTRFSPNSPILVDCRQKADHALCRNTWTSCPIDGGNSQRDHFITIFLVFVLGSANFIMLAYLALRYEHEVIPLFHLKCLNFLSSIVSLYIVIWLQMMYYSNMLGLMILVVFVLLLVVLLTYLKPRFDFGFFDLVINIGCQYFLSKFLSNKIASLSCFGVCCVFIVVRNYYHDIMTYIIAHFPPNQQHGQAPPPPLVPPPPPPPIVPPSTRTDDQPRDQASSSALVPPPPTTTSDQSRDQASSSTLVSLPTTTSDQSRDQASSSTAVSLPTPSGQPHSQGSSSMLVAPPTNQEDPQIPSPIHPPPSPYATTQPQPLTPLQTPPPNEGSEESTTPSPIEGNEETATSEPVTPLQSPPPNEGNEETTTYESSSHVGDPVRAVQDQSEHGAMIGSSSSRGTEQSVADLISTVNLTSGAELACSYACMILHDDGISITAENIAKLLKAANVTVESYWPRLFAMLAEKQNINDLMRMGFGAYGVPAAISASASAEGAGTSASAEVAGTMPVEEGRAQG